MRLKALWKKYRAYLAVSAVLVAGACCLLFYARPEEEVQRDIVVTGSMNDTEFEGVESKESVEDRDEDITAGKPEADGAENIPVSESIAMEDAIVEEPEEKISEEVTEEKAQIESVMEESRESVSESALESIKPPETVSEQIQVSTPVPTPVPQSTATPKPEDTPTPAPVDTPTSVPEVNSKPCTHNWIFMSYYQEPTCGNGGLENQVCAVCGETQTISGTPTGEHSFVVETPGDCCTEEMVRCEECNHREVRAKDAGKHIDVEGSFCYGCGQEVKDSE